MNAYGLFTHTVSIPLSYAKLDMGGAKNGFPPPPPAGVNTNRMLHLSKEDVTKGEEPQTPEASFWANIAEENEVVELNTLALLAVVQATSLLQTSTTILEVPSHEKGVENVCIFQPTEGVKVAA
jgi:hypothetical protein